MLPTLHIRGGRLIDPATGRDEIDDLFIADGRIVPSLSGQSDVRVIDAAGLTVVPGLIDLHVHLREPGREEAETIASGSAAAARGGFTRVVAMPNTTPPQDTPARIAATLERGRRAGRVHVLPSACITRGRAGLSLAPLAELAAAGAVAFTDDGSTVTNDAVMREAMRIACTLGLPVMDHALDPAVEGGGVMHAGAQSHRLGLPGIPPRAEANMIERDIRLAEETGAAMHIQHISTRGGVELLRAARARGTTVSAEVTPHHLALCDDDVDGSDADFKMSPPLCGADDRAALIDAIVDGTIQAFATDHAPHTTESKSRGFIAAPCGVLGLETAVGVSYTRLVRSGRMPLCDWVRRWTTGPAAILHCAAPSLAPCKPADLTLLDLQTEWTVDPRHFLSKSRNTPFKGWTLHGQAVLTIRGGSITWDGHS